MHQIANTMVRFWCTLLIYIELGQNKTQTQIQNMSCISHFCIAHTSIQNLIFLVLDDSTYFSQYYSEILGPNYDSVRCYEQTNKQKQKTKKREANFYKIVVTTNFTHSSIWNIVKHSFAVSIQINGVISLNIFNHAVWKKGLNV